MSEMTARIRNRLQDGMVNWQEKRFRQSDFRQQQADIYRSRMTCSSSLRSFNQAQDWTVSLPVNSRIPVIEETKPRQPLVSSEGIRWDAALTVLIVIGVILAAFLLADVASIGSSGRMISKLNTSIQDLEAKNERTQAEIQLNSDSASVCTEAVKLNLISSNGAQTIRLTVPGNAQLTLSTAAKASENADLQARLTSYAGD